MHHLMPVLDALLAGCHCRRHPAARASRLPPPAVSCHHPGPPYISIPALPSPLSLPHSRPAAVATAAIITPAAAAPATAAPRPPPSPPPFPPPLFATAVATAAVATAAVAPPALQTIKFQSHFLLILTVFAPCHVFCCCEVGVCFCFITLVCFAGRARACVFLNVCRVFVLLCLSCPHVGRWLLLKKIGASGVS